MFLLERIDFLALVSLWVQAFAAWVFVVVLGALRKPDRSSRALDQFFLAFLALALALTVLSGRFFQAHDLATQPFWQDGNWPATTCYLLYQGLKGCFALALVRGCAEIGGRSLPRAFRWIAPPTLVALLVSPLWIASIDHLLVVQAPVMFATALLSLRALGHAHKVDAGPRLVRVALLGLALTWCVHAAAALLQGTWPWVLYVLACNSLFDLGVQLCLGAGLVVSLLQAAHRRAREAEAERERLERALAHDEKLRALGALVSGVAHELNNPLTVILGYAELLSGTSQGQAQGQVIAEQAERCRGIVRNLSALAGQSSHPREAIDVAELLQRVGRGVALRADQRAVTVRIQPVGGLAIHGDRVGLEQVLANLTLNAIDASAPRSVVTLAVEASTAAVEFTVTDQGPGVPAHQRARIFEPFFTTKEAGQGTGLGLSIAHGIVRGHRGTILVEDAPGGRGARFRVRLPLVPPAPVRAPRAAPAVQGERRLLVLDDDPAVRSVLRLHAEARGWQVVEVDSAEAALADRPRLRDCDALLCDLRMVGLGGIGFHDHLLAAEPELLAHTVFATGDLASPEVVQFSRRCQRPLVPKPFDLDELFAALDGAAQGRTAARPVGTAG
jgi:signal transduction histidine kinase/ActR/RegA family two-component response regulator